MNYLHSIRADLVDKRLVPVVGVLAALAILVPVGAGLLSSSSSSAPVIGPAIPTTPPPGTPSPASALATIAGPGTPTAKRYTGRELDPFRQRAAAFAGTTTTAAKATTGAASTSAAKTTTAAAPKTTTTTPVVKPTPTTTTPAPTTPVATPSPQAQLAKLGGLDSYGVDVNVVDATGGHRLASLERLSPLPSPTNPLLEYLGVVKGGRAVAFLVNPGTVAQGPGRCLPKPSDCQVVELKPGQLEALSARSGGGPVTQAAVAVSGWRVISHSSVAAARQARTHEVSQGRTLLSQSAQPALTDLAYSVATGAVSIIPAIVNALPGALSKILGG